MNAPTGEGADDIKCPHCGSQEFDDEFHEVKDDGKMFDDSNVECRYCGEVFKPQFEIDLDKPRRFRHQYDALGSTKGAAPFDYQNVTKTQRFKDSNTSDSGDARDFLQLNNNDEKFCFWELITSGNLQHPFVVSVTPQKSLRTELGNPEDLVDESDYEEGKVYSTYDVDWRIDTTKVLTKIVSDSNRVGTEGIRYWASFGLLMHLQADLGNPWSLQEWIARLQISDREFDNWFSGKGIVSTYTFQQINLSKLITGITEESDLDKGYFISAIEGMFVHLYKFNYLDVKFSREIRNKCNQIVDLLTKRKDGWDLSTFIDKACILSLGQNRDPVKISSWGMNQDDAITCPLLSTPILLITASALTSLGYSRKGYIDTLTSLVQDDCKRSSLNYEQTITYWNHLLDNNELSELKLPLGI